MRNTMTQETAAAETRCQRCGRRIKAGIYGPRCAAIVAATEGLNAKQVDKMAELISDRAIVPAARKGTYLVVNEAGEVVHKCHVNGNCSCAWGNRRDSALIKTCYHVAGARLLARPVIRTAPAAPRPVIVIPAPAPAFDWAAMERFNEACMLMPA